MSFVPGSIAGELILGIDGFTQPLLSAEHLAEAFPELMQQSLAQPLAEIGQMADQAGGAVADSFATINSTADSTAGAVEDSTGRSRNAFNGFVGGAHEAGDASEEMSHSILKSMIEAQGIMELFPEWVAVFWANPLLGVADLAKEAGEAIIDVFRHVEDEALDMELASEKLGVSVEFLSQWSAVAQTVKVDAEQLSNGFYMMTRIVGEELQNPTKELTRAFSLLGISQQWLNDNASNSEAIFTRVKEGIDLMTDASDRNYVIQQLMSKGARDLIPLMLLQEDQVHSLMQAQRDLGDVTDAREGKAARAFQVLRTGFDEAWGGIEKALVMPALDFLAAHADQIKTELIKDAKFVRDEIGKAWDFIESIDWNKALGKAITMFHDLKDTATGFWNTLNGDVQEFQEIAAGLKPIADLMAWMAKQNTTDFTQVGVDVGTGYHGASTPWGKPLAPDIDPKTRLDTKDKIYQPLPTEHPLPNPHFSSMDDFYDYYSPHNRRQYDPTDPDNQPLKPGQTVNKYHIVVNLPQGASPSDAKKTADAVLNAQKKLHADAAASRSSAATGGQN